MNWSYKSFTELSGSEVYEILKLRADIFVVEQNCPFPEIDGHDYESLHVCCMSGVELLAYARLLPAGVKYEEPSIGRVVIRPDKRGMGLAHTLMEYSVQTVRENWNHDKIHLQAQSHLAKFYTKHGFEIMSVVY